MQNREYNLNSNDTLIVDIGRYTIAYTVTTPDKSIKFFKIESFTPDVSDIFEDKTIRFIEAVVKSVREIKIDFQTIEDIVIVIPTKDILLSSKGDINQKVIRDLLEDQYNISEDTGLAQSVSRPYKIGNRFFAPISFYDENINLLITELDRIGNPIKDVVRGNVIFQTSIYRMIEVAGRTTGKVAIIDSSFNSTRVLLAKDGHPVEYNEFELCGEDMLKMVYSNSSKSISDIVKIMNSYDEALANSIPEAIVAHNYLKSEAERGVLPHLKKTAVDKVLFMGGLSNTDYLDGLGIPVEKLEINYSLHRDLLNSGVDSIPEPVNYKIMMSLATPVHGGLLDKRNVDIILGKRDINDYSPREDSDEDIILKTEEIIGDENEYNNDELVKITKEVKQSLGINEDEGNTQPSIKILNLDQSDDKKETLVVKSVTSEQLNLLDTLKKKYKEPSKYEKKTPVLISGIIVFICLVASLAMMNKNGYINNNLFKLMGIQQPEIVAYKNDYTSQIDQKIAKTVKQLEINGSSIKIAKDISGNKSVVQTQVSVPKEVDFKQNFGFYFTKNIELLLNKDVDIEINVDDSNKIRNVYVVTIKYKQSNKKNDGGEIKLTGATKWTEEEYRLFFDSNDYDDFLNGTRKIGDPSRAEREKNSGKIELNINSTNKTEDKNYNKFVPGLSDPKDHTAE